MSRRTRAALTIELTGEGTPLAHALSALNRAVEQMQRRHPSVETRLVATRVRLKPRAPMPTEAYDEEAKTELVS